MIISGKVSVGSNSVSGSVNSSQDISGNVDKAENIYVKEIEFNNRYEFPSIGKENMIYVARDENALYIFDTTQNIYHCIGRDYNEIGSIQCQLKED